MNPKFFSTISRKKEVSSTPLVAMHQDLHMLNMLSNHALCMLRANPLPELERYPLLGQV